MRSFIKPRKKKLLDDLSILWIAFIALMSLGLIIFGVFVNYKSSFYIKMLESKSSEMKNLSAHVKDLRDDIQIISMQKELYHEVNVSNNRLKESVKNLFELVPDQVTLTEVIMEKNSLLLKGYSVSKETYTLLLEPPLKSIFDESKVVFSVNDGGFYTFTSQNNIYPKESRDD